MSIELDQRVLVLAPRGRDAAVIAETLSGIDVCICADIATLESEVKHGAGAALVTEEALVAEALEGLTAWIAAQPPWSDLPIVVLAAQRVGPRPPGAQQALKDLGNIVILERPLNTDTLQRAATSALRARNRQYHARSHLQERLAFAATLEERIRERTAELAEANAKLRQEIEDKERMNSVLVQSQKMEAVGQLTGGVAHDFNNLLTIIRSSVDFLGRPDVPLARRTRYIEAISQTVDRAAKLTGQLLAFARRQTLIPIEFDVGAQVESVVELVRPIVGSRILLETEICAVACSAKADINQFETALINLAVNGRDAMQGDGRLVFRVEPVTEVPSVRGHAGAIGDFVVVTVEDSGCGIPEDKISQIFEPFFTTKEVGKGTGLGLSQVFGFAKQSGGEITVQSEEGRGAIFRLYLPRVQTQAPQINADGTEGDEPKRLHRGLRVLVVEDNDAVGQFAVEMLTDLGHIPVRATNAQDALEALGADGAAFDALFSDVMMPGMNGVAMAREIRSRFGPIPILLTSGYSQVTAMEGTHGFELLTKPYSVDALAQRLQQVVLAAE